MIQWFPGHMNKARRQVSEAMREIDVVLEILDARLPAASTNPMIAELRTYERGGQPYTVPAVRLLNKTDLANADITRQWLDMLRDDQTYTFGLQATDTKTTFKIAKLCKKLSPRRVQQGRPVRVMVQGVPNCGKSTLINTLKGRKVAKKGDEAAVTRGLQRVQLDNGLILHDTPGLMWPKIEDPHQGFLLAMSGAVRASALDVAHLGVQVAGWLFKYHRDALAGRYKTAANLEDETADLEVLEAIGRGRGCLVSGGDIDHNKAADILLNDLRGGRLGRLSFETPDGRYRETPPPAVKVLEANDGDA